MKTIKIYYRRNLNMSPGKLAAQSVHAALGLKDVDAMDSVVVLEASDKKFAEILANHLTDSYVVSDAGYTELPTGTKTCLAFVENQ